MWGSKQHLPAHPLHARTPPVWTSTDVPKPTVPELTWGKHGADPGHRIYGVLKTSVIKMNGI